MITTNYFVFFDNATVSDPGDIVTSKVLMNPSGECITLGVSGDTFEGSITIQGNQGDAWFDLAVVRLSDVTVLETMDAPGAYVVVCPDGFIGFRAVATITAGALTVTARVTTEV